MSTSDTAAARPSVDEKVRKSKRAAQFESFRPLASCDLEGSIKGTFGRRNVRRIAAQQKLTPNTMQFGIEPMLAGLFRPGDQLAQNFQPGVSCPAAAFATATCIPQNGSQR